jgi:hypothetical protein
MFFIEAAAAKLKHDLSSLSLIFLSNTSYFDLERFFEQKTTSIAINFWLLKHPSIEPVTPKCCSFDDLHSIFPLT